ncbi:MAG TPA: SRPBCC domain-containing protein [Thermoanaerobaculia bacterium]
MSRTFDAPRGLVFKAWTEREHLMHWWGPAAMTMELLTADIRPGGTMHYSMRSPDGQEMWGKWAIRDVVVPERLVWINSFSDAEGNVTRAPFAPEFPLEVLSVVTLDEHDGKTTLTMQGVPLNPTEAERKLFDAFHASMQMGWGATLDKLDAHLSTRS